MGGGGGGGGGGVVVSLSGVRNGFQMTRDELEKGTFCPPTTKSLGTCLHVLSWAPQGISKTEISKWTFYKFLTTK